MALGVVRAELAIADEDDSLSRPDVNFALMSASALTAENEERAQDAVLRIAHGALRDPGRTDEQVAAAMVLLDRVGNRLAIQLAVDRYNLEKIDYQALPRVVATDALARREQLTLTGSDGADMEVNPFQREFWMLVHLNDWVSVSAPTSAGKSHIVREWMKAELSVGGERRLVYVAPTRALVEEVGTHFRQTLDRSIGVHTLPWDPDIANFTQQVFVLTQERLHLLQERSPSFSPDIVFIDEAQKIAEGTRGILLTQVLDEAVMRNPSIRLVFASPMSRNPGVLFGEHDKHRSVAALVGESVTVSQNLIYVKQKLRHQDIYEFTLRYRGDEHHIGELKLTSKPERVGERVPFVAARVGRLSGGNLVYANGPAEAEKYARLIFEALGESADLHTDGIEELIDFARGTVHERFVLAEYARRGVAFHYGDMPLVLKAKVEEHFKNGNLRYLVCTSTLLEGVNLPCKNIFMRGPFKGPAHMSMSDFWNLAGRAGRWGKEFQGNIFCVDAHNESVWPEKPLKRERSDIVPAAARALQAVPQVLEYIASGAHMASREFPAELESAFSWLSGRYLAHRDLDKLTGVVVSPEARELLLNAVVSAVDDITLPERLVKRHAGISPLSMQRMFEVLLEHGHPEQLALVPPTSDGAQAEYERALEYVADYLGGSFAAERRRLQLSGLIVNWMSGMPLSRIIEGRARYRRQNGIEFNYPKLIRDTMGDVEDIARFEAPKYLSCYSDLVSAAAVTLGREIDNQVIDIEMMLELGVPRKTDMSFIAAGLSRATCTVIATYVRDPDLSPSDCMAWIREVDIETLDIPAFAARELAAVREVLAARLW